MLRKAIFSFGFLLLTLTSWAQPGGDLKMADMQYDIARNFKEALKLYEPLARSAQLSNDDRVKVLRRIATSYRLLNEPEKAAEHYELLKKGYPNAVQARDHFYHGYVLQMQGKYDEAKTAYGNYRMMAPSKEADYFYDDVIDYAKQESQATSNYDIRLEKVNSSMDDFSPTFYKSGLVFASKKEIGNVSTGGGSVLDYLYVVNRASNGALHGAKQFNSTNGSSPSNAAPLVIDNVRKNVYYSLNNLQDGVRHIGYAISRIDLYQESYKQKGTPSFDEASGKPILWGQEGVYKIGFPAISPDGQTLVVAAKKAGEPFNLYQLTKNTMGDWINPKKLDLNTPENDLAPFIDANNVLYYSSDGGAGLGGLDVFAAKYDAQKKTWTTPGNLGNGVNSSYDDMYFIWDAASKMAYFSSNRPGGTGGLDIYRAAPSSSSMAGGPEPTPKPQQGTSQPSGNSGNVTVSPAEPSTEPTPKPQQGTSQPSGNSGNVAVNPAEASNGEVYYGALLDAQTNYYLRDANVTLHEVGTTNKSSTTTNEYGEYAFKLDKYTEYTLVCSKREYENVIFNINTRAGRQKLILGERRMRKPDEPPIQSFGQTAETNTGSTASLGGSRSIADNATYRLGNKSELPEKGYKIQLGLFAKSGFDVERRLAPLERHGLLMSEDRSNGSVYSLGIYAKRDHANSVLSKVKTQGDFKDAFIREVDLDILTMEGQEAEEDRVIYPKEADPTANPVSTTVDEAPKRLEYRLGTTEELPKEGYFLQLGAYKDLDAETRADLNELKRYAKVFPIQRGELTAYRLGLFADKAHAERIKQKLQNTRFKAAYMGTELINKNSAGAQMQYSTRVVYPKETPSSASGATQSNWTLDKQQPGSSVASNGDSRSWANNEMANIKPEEELPEQAKVRSPSGVAYKVQLGAFSKPGDFDTERFEEIGYVETKKTAAGLTYFFLANYPSVDAARAASRRAEEKGINSPTIVAYLNGSRISLQKAIAMDK